LGVRVGGSYRSNIIILFGQYNLILKIAKGCVLKYAFRLGTLHVKNTYETNLQKKICAESEAVTKVDYRRPQPS